MANNDKAQDVGARPQISLRRVTTIAVIALIYAAAVFLAVSNLEPQTLHAVLTIPALLILSLLGLSLANYALRAGRWHFVSSELKFPTPSLRNVLYYIAGFSLASTPGKTGEAVRLWLLKRGHQIEYVRSAPLMVTDRVFDAYAVLLLTFVSAAHFSNYHWQIAFIGMIVLAASAPLLAPAGFYGLMQRAARGRPKIERGLQFIKPSMDSLAMLRSWRIYGFCLGAGLLGWIAECGSLYLLLKYFGADVSFANAIFVFCFSMLVGAVSFLPGGLGSTEATMLVLLSVLGVELSTSVAATAIVRITTFWFAVFIGLVAAPIAIRLTSKPALREAGGGPL